MSVAEMRDKIATATLARGRIHSFEGKLRKLPPARPAQPLRTRVEREHRRSPGKRRLRPPSAKRYRRAQPMPGGTGWDHNDSCRTARGYMPAGFRLSAIAR